ncbi:N-acetylmuramoyl-L-alanine amidase [bacterium]|nr:N-acetylmuramoyl-L-alanine amidase [bacterium]
MSFSTAKKILFILLFLSFFPLSAEKKFKVVIDPGHGGTNTGAVSGNISEKELTLALASKIRVFFKKHPAPGVEIIFTRTDDSSMTIKERVEFIERLQPDLFISLHFNSQKVLTTNRGFEIYYPADFVSSDTASTALFYDKVNRSFNYGSIFRDLYFKANLHTTWKLPLNMFSQKYNFGLFEDTTVPGLLLEIAYITSPEDRACIENPLFTADVAWFIYDAIIKIANKNQ